ncbi:DUF11 domain-containing protein [Patescibacteria group bacterium]
MINVFGNWEGDLTFGRPDLWIGESAVTSLDFGIGEEGETVTYTLTYINNGDADAHDVSIVDDFDENYLDIIDTGGGVLLDNPGEVEWEIGTVPAGSFGSVSYTAAINGNVSPGNSIYITNTSLVRSIEEDWNDEDNTDSLSLLVESLYTTSPFQARLIIEKKSETGDFTYAGENINYQIVLYNDSSESALDVFLEDVLSNQDSLQEFNSYTWDLGEVFPYEKIIIDYTVAVGSEVPVGFYENTALAIGVNGRGSAVWSNDASVVVEVKEKEVPEIQEEIQEYFPEEKIIQIKKRDEMTLEDIERLLGGMAQNINIIDEYVTRTVPLPEFHRTETEPGLELESELGLESEGESGFIGEISETFIPEVLASKDESLPPVPEKLGFEKFLASIGNFLSLDNFLPVLVFSIIMLVLLFLTKKKKNKK